MQRRRREAVARRLVYQRLVGRRLYEIHEPVKGAANVKMLVVVAVHEIDNGLPSPPETFDEARDVLFEGWIIALVPALTVALERVLNVDDQQCVLHEWSIANACA